MAEARTKKMVLVLVLSTAFKIVDYTCEVDSKEVPVSLSDLINLRKARYDLSGTDILTLPKVNGTTYGLRSWYYMATKLWNSFPDSLRTVTSHKSFKTKIDKLDPSGL